MLPRTSTGRSPPRESFRSWARRRPWAFWAVFWLIAAATTAALAERSGLLDTLRGWLPITTFRPTPPG